MKLRIWLASFGLLTLVTATLFLVVFDLMKHDIKASLPALVIPAFVWVISIPSLIRLRKMIAHQRADLK